MFCWLAPKLGKCETGPKRAKRFGWWCFALLFLPSLNNEGNMTTNGTLQSAKDDLSMQAQLDKRQQLLQSDTLMERDDFCCLLFVDVLVSCANRFQRTCCWQTEWHLTLWGKKSSKWQSWNWKDVQVQKEWDTGTAERLSWHHAWTPFLVLNGVC